MPPYTPALMGKDRVAGATPESLFLVISTLFRHKWFSALGKTSSSCCWGGTGSLLWSHGLGRLSGELSVVFRSETFV